jgi:ribosome biogenesis GTPase / thiamine phosphate phosphatase
MTLDDLGYERVRDLYRDGQDLEAFTVGRVVAEHRERYLVRTGSGEFEAEITGNIRFTATNREDFPSVGDWVAMATYDSDQAIIHRILPRYSVIRRQAAGKAGEVQIIATNIDYGLIIQAADRDFNLNRLERYLTICNSSGVLPVIVISKADLAEGDQLQRMTLSIEQRITDTPVICISNRTRQGYEALGPYLKKGTTCCMLGSSGIGKSTLLNNLSGQPIMETGTISAHTNKGKHVTSHRELVVLEQGGILIDNPGMREVGIADTGQGLDVTFDRILRYAGDCRYSDCTHTSEAGCSVIAAFEAGDIGQAEYENYLRMEREKAFFNTTLEERRRKDKEFGKIMKNYKKNKRKNGY